MYFIKCSVEHVGYTHHIDLGSCRELIVKTQRMTVQVEREWKKKEINRDKPKREIILGRAESYVLPNLNKLKLILST